MKIITFFSFVMLLSIGVVACKDNSKSEAVNASVSLENTMEASKAQLDKNITELLSTINNKITETENQLTSAGEEAKAGLNAKLDILHKQRTDLGNLAIKAKAATAESWADFNQQAARMVDEVKEALSK
ncbi:MAG: hypothetical protein ABJC12_10770 [Saprospiraceae bacterium]